MATNQTFNIIIADDHALFREGLRLLIEVEQIGHVVAEAQNGAELVKLLGSHNPHMIILDIDMPVLDGFEAAQQALKLYPNLKILVVSMHGTHQWYNRFIELGVKGFILKSAGKTELEMAIRKIAQNETYFSPQLLMDILKQLKNAQSNPQPEINLTGREKTILQMFCNGHTTPEIAKKINLSPKTIDNCRLGLLSKTATNNTLSLVLFAIKNKLVTNF
jgi:DNA-binding NarL/FixJ family response regulator